MLIFQSAICTMQNANLYEVVNDNTMLDLGTLDGFVMIADKKFGIHRRFVFSLLLVR